MSKKLTDFLNGLTEKEYEELEQAYINENFKNQALEKLYTDHIDTSGHGIEHIKDVIVHMRQSIEQLKEIGITDVNQDIAIACAAYHDIGNFVGRELHEMNSYAILRGQLTAEDIVMNSKTLEEKLSQPERKKLLNDVNLILNGTKSYADLTFATQKHKEHFVNVFARMCEFKMVYEGNGKCESIDINNKKEFEDFITSVVKDENLAKMVCDTIVSEENIKNNIFDKSLSFNHDLQAVRAEYLRNFPDEKERAIIEQAVIDHRKDKTMNIDGQKVDYNAKSIYGQLVYDADKETEAVAELKRNIDYGIKHSRVNGKTIDEVEDCPEKDCLMMDVYCSAIQEYVLRHRTKDLETNIQLLSDAREMLNTIAKTDEERAIINNMLTQADGVLNRVDKKENGKIVIVPMDLSKSGKDTRLQTMEYLKDKYPEKYNSMDNWMKMYRSNMRSVHLTTLLNAFMTKEAFERVRQDFKDIIAASDSYFKYKQDQLDSNNEMNTFLKETDILSEYSIIENHIGDMARIIINERDNSIDFLNSINGEIPTFIMHDTGRKDENGKAIYSRSEVCVINEKTINNEEYMSNAEEKCLPIIRVGEKEVEMIGFENSIDDYINNFESDAKSQDIQIREADILDL